MIQENIKNVIKSEWINSELNKCNTNLESLIHLYNSNLKLNKESKCYNKCFLFSYGKNITDLTENNNPVKSIIFRSLKSNSSNIVSILRYLIAVLDENYNSLFSITSKVSKKRCLLGKKKKVFVRVVLSIASLDHYKQEDLEQALHSFNPLFEVVFNPIILVDEFISQRFCSEISDLDFIDFKNKS